MLCGIGCVAVVITRTDRSQSERYGVFVRRVHCFFGTAFDGARLACATGGQHEHERHEAEQGNTLKKARNSAEKVRHRFLL